MYAHLRQVVLGVSVAALLAACGSSAPMIKDRMDPLTGATVTRATVPLVLYKENSAQAAYARDFVYVGPLRVNRMGTYSHFLWLGIWSSINNADISAERDGFDSIVIFADGEPLQLELQGWTLASIGVSEQVYNKPTASAADAYFAVTLDQIRVIAEARDIRLQGTGLHANAYELWDNQKRAQSSIRDFLRYLYD